MSEASWTIFLAHHMPFTGERFLNRGQADPPKSPPCRTRGLMNPPSAPTKKAERFLRGRKSSKVTKPIFSKPWGRTVSRSISWTDGLFTRSRCQNSRPSPSPTLANLTFTKAPWSLTPRIGRVPGAFKGRKKTSPSVRPTGENDVPGFVRIIDTAFKSSIIRLRRRFT